MTYSNEEYSTAEMYKLGIDCLIDKFGIVNTEKFLAAVKSSDADYTEMRRGMFEDMTVQEYDAEVIDYGRNHPRMKTGTND